MKNIKIQVTGLMLLSATIVFGQVGIYTANPQGAFHVDGAHDNTVSGNPTADQQANDFIVTSNGAVGIGTITPNSTFETSGSVSMGVTTIDASLDLTTGNYYTIIYTGGTSAPTLTLADPTTCKGRMYHIINGSSAGNYQDIILSRQVYLYSGNSSNLVVINTFSTSSSVTDQTIGNTVLIQSDGNKWWRIGQ